MSSPYRRHRKKAAVGEAPKTGLVADMVRQFADSYAFLRELVQNSIDAGTSSIEVTLGRTSDGETTTSVTDAGSGMTLAIVESALLTLFNSSKEGDESKIGKYGVGFISVLALNPTSVVVETWRDGRTLRVRIGRDQRYVIEEVEPRPESGTRVSLEHQMTAEEFAEHATRAREALARWCRHAAIPIYCAVTDYSNPNEAMRVRIDRPLSVFTVVSVSEEGPDHRIVVGPSAGSECLERPSDLPELEAEERFSGFYNHGLTLHESTTEEFPGLGSTHFKISSPRLKHTLSRDDVRRDRELDRLVDRTRKLAAKSLPVVVATELRKEAGLVAEGADPSRYLGLLDAALAEPVSLDGTRIWFPLTDPVRGSAAMTLDQVLATVPWRDHLLTSPGRDALTRALAADGRAVVLCPTPRIALLLGTVAKRGHLLAHARYVLTKELLATELTPADRTLLLCLADVMASGGRPVERVGLVHALGARPSHTVIGRDSTGLGPVEEIRKVARSFGDGATLYLDTRDEAVQLARKRAASAPKLAAELLARVILLERKGPLSERANDRLLGTGA